MSKKWNQFKQHMMQQNKSDTEKLVLLCNKISREFSIYPLREHILLFDKETKRFIKITEGITEEEYHNHIIHVPDITLYIRDQLWIIEIDGWVHNVKSKVIEKDKLRNECYALSGIPHIIINEWNALYDLGIHQERSATPEELWPSLKEKIEQQIK